VHIAIDRLYNFVMGGLDLADDEQSHLIRCDFCIEWLDACATQKLAELSKPLKHQTDLAPSSSSGEL
jgi:hypothetical protein